MNKLILHFDINGTITPVDTTESGTELEIANMIISKNVYGNVIDNKWILNENVYDQTHSITYYDHLKKNDKDNCKKISFRFTNEGEPGENLNYLVDKVIDSMNKLLFNSFLNVIDEFPDALIVLRTFGPDTDKVIEKMKIVGKSNTFVKGLFSYEGDCCRLSLENGNIFTGMTNINDLFKTSNDYLALKENYHYWNDNKRNKVYGKQLVGDDDVLQIFFDDNDCVNVINDTNVHNITINTLCAMLDDNYYINKIYDAY